MTPKEQRLALGLSQAQAAKIAGVNPCQISKIESNIYAGRTDTEHKIRRALAALAREREASELRKVGEQ